MTAKAAAVPGTYWLGTYTDTFRVGLFLSLESIGKNLLFLRSIVNDFIVPLGTSLRAFVSGAAVYIGPILILPSARMSLAGSLAVPCPHAVGPSCMVPTPMARPKRVAVQITTD